MLINTHNPLDVAHVCQKLCEYEHSGFQSYFKYEGFPTEIPLWWIKQALRGFLGMLDLIPFIVSQVWLLETCPLLWVTLSGLIPATIKMEFILVHMRDPHVLTVFKS